MRGREVEWTLGFALADCHCRDEEESGINEKSATEEMTKGGYMMSAKLEAGFRFVLSKSKLSLYKCVQSFLQIRWVREFIALCVWMSGVNMKVAK